MVDETSLEETTYNIVNDRYMLEWQRTQNIENKAICIIGFVGVLLVFSVDMGFSHLSVFENHWCMSIFYACYIALLLITLYVTMKALFFGNEIMWALDAAYTMSNYVRRGRPIIRAVTDGLNDGIAYNSELNAVKNTSLKWAVNLFSISVIFLLVFISWFANVLQPDIMENILNNSSDGLIKINDQNNVNKTNYTFQKAYNNTLIIYPIGYTNSYRKLICQPKRY